jgi:membrane protein
VIFAKGLKKRHKMTRLIQVCLAVGLIFGLVHLWQSSLINGNQLLNSQTQVMARLLAQQAANGAAPAMYLKNTQQIEWLANTLVTDPKIMSVNIYDSSGNRLAFAQSVSSEKLDPDSKELEELLKPYAPLIENVTQGDNNLGYVEVRLNPNIFFDEIKILHEENMQLQQIMLIVAGIIGLLLSKSMSFKRAEFDRLNAIKPRVKKPRKSLK